ncbi:MAG TPA: hypothetical protein VFH68_10340 [Polyangia bacterium]|jgi:hypothetical protein|nr:hypothetical protein [Polyangia bacterium]
MRRDWECPFHIGLPPDAGIEFGHGIDAFQALIQAIEGIRTRLEQRRRQFTWRGGEPGDAGFPRLVPMFYGRQFAERINKLIDDEVLRFASNAARAAGHDDEVLGVARNAAKAVGHDENGSARPKPLRDRARKRKVR